MILEALLVPMIAIAAIAQVRMGISFAPGEVVTYRRLRCLCVLAISVITVLLRRVPPAGLSAAEDRGSAPADAAGSSS